VLIFGPVPNLWYGRRIRSDGKEHPARSMCWLLVTQRSAAQRSAESGVHVLYPLLRSYDGYPLVVAGLAINDTYLIRTSGIFITRLRHSR